MKTRFKKGKWIKALVATYFQCQAITTFYKVGSVAITTEEAEQQLIERGWTNTPKGFYCAGCLDQDATEMIAAVSELDLPPIVEAETGSEQTEVVSQPGTGTFTVMAITPEGCKALKRQFQQSREIYLGQLLLLDMLLTTVQSIRFGEATGEVHTLLEEMVETKRATLEEAIEVLSTGIAELERGGY